MHKAYRVCCVSPPILYHGEVIHVQCLPSVDSRVCLVRRSYSILTVRRIQDRFGNGGKGRLGGGPGQGGSCDGLCEGMMFSEEAWEASLTVKRLIAFFVTGGIKLFCFV